MLGLLALDELFEEEPVSWEGADRDAFSDADAFFDETAWSNGDVFSDGEDFPDDAA